MESHNSLILTQTIFPKTTKSVKEGKSKVENGKICFNVLNVKKKRELSRFVFSYVIQSSES
jgi:hypothetical protein